MRLKARIAALRQETPTVRSFRLDLGGQRMAFRPGQWVDCYALVEGQCRVAGYSITSAPVDTGVVEIAVKLAGENPVTRFLHQRAGVGDSVWLEGGSGEVFFTADMAASVVLVAGGIGITPLMSILRYVDLLAPGVRATLLYSAGSPQELIFRQELEAMAARNPRIRCLLTVTRPATGWHGRTGRIDAAMLREAGVEPGSLYFLCGPPGMVEDLKGVLEGEGVPSAHIRYEAW